VICHWIGKSDREVSANSQHEGHPQRGKKERKFTSKEEKRIICARKMRGREIVTDLVDLVRDSYPTIRGIEFIHSKGGGKVLQAKRSSGEKKKRKAIELPWNTTSDEEGESLPHSNSFFEERVGSSKGRKDT